MNLALVLPALCLVTDCRLCSAERLVSTVAAAVDGGVTMVQLREKDLPAVELFRLALALKEAVGDRALVLVNDRVDVALATGADGIQLGAGSLPVPAARALVGSGRLLGRSVHNVAEAVQAERDGADFLVLGTIYPSRSHPGTPGAGPGLVGQVKAAVQVPIIAIGGVDAGNAGEVMAAGAAGVAVISAILGAAAPRAAARDLATAVAAGWRLREVPR